MSVSEVAEELLRIDPNGDRWSQVIRQTYDMIYNGQETGRFYWDQLMKTEKTHFGTLFEINAQRAFGFEGGNSTDFRIAGHQVDAKWSQTRGAWMLPPEVVGELALVATGSDVHSKWSLGLIKVTADVLREGTNRDRKSQLNPQGKASVTWLWDDAVLPPNVLLQLPRPTVDIVFGSKYGTQRTNQLFRAAEGLIVSRTAVATVSRQLDPQKRVRYNGGARSALRGEGYLILSGLYHRELAASFKVSVPRRDEYISIRVVPSESEAGVTIAGQRWRLALPGEAVTQPAPLIGDKG